MVGTMAPRHGGATARGVDHDQSVGNEEWESSRSCLAFRFPKKRSSSSSSSVSLNKSRGNHASHNSSANYHRKNGAVPIAQRSKADGEAMESFYSSTGSNGITSGTANTSLTDHPSPSTSAPHRSMESLLVPPTPMDRSPHLRARQRAVGLTYDGELEPEGIRGQEAVVLPVTGVAAPTPTTTNSNATAGATVWSVQPLRPSQTQGSASWNPTTSHNSSSSPAVVEALQSQPTVHKTLQPWQFSTETGQAVRIMAAPVVSNNNNNNSATGDWHHKSPLPRNQWGEEDDDDDDDDSTNSDDDIQYMMPDLLPSRSDLEKTHSTAISDHNNNDNNRITSDNRQEFFPNKQQYSLSDAALRRKYRHAEKSILAQLHHTTNTETRANNNTTISMATNSLLVNPTNTTTQPDPTGTIRNTLSASPLSLAAPSPPPTLLPASKARTEELTQMNERAMQHVHAGQYDQAIQLFSFVLETQRQMYGPVHPTVASAYHNLGTVYAKKASATTTVVNVTRQSPLLWPRQHEQQDPATPRHLDDNDSTDDHHPHHQQQLVQQQQEQQQRQFRSQALDCFQAAARAARDSLGRNHPNVAVSLVRIGFLLLQSQQYQNAIITFQEALRIRLAHYGPKHSLVANLYNNLGVCHMHCQNFERGRAHLHNALSIQRALCEEREIMAMATGGNDNNNTPTTERVPPSSVSSTDGGASSIMTTGGSTVGTGTTTKHNKVDPWVHQLELADTLFNLGGLALEWIRQDDDDNNDNDGDDTNNNNINNKNTKEGSYDGDRRRQQRRQEAIDAFTECYEIRCRVLGGGNPHDPAIEQAQQLLQVAVATTGVKRSSSGGGGNNPAVKSTDSTANRSWKSYPTVTRAVSPEPTTGTVTTDLQQQVASLGWGAASTHEDISSKVTTMPLYSSASLSAPADDNTPSSLMRNMDIFRPRSRQSERISPLPPLIEVSISRDENDDDRNEPTTGTNITTTTMATRTNQPDDPTSMDRLARKTNRIFVEPLWVPEQSPIRPSPLDVSTEAVAGFHTSYHLDATSADTTSTDHAMKQRSGQPHLRNNYSYDAEENCLLNDSGIDSEHGRVHFPWTWNKLADTPVKADIVVTRPYRKSGSGTPKRSDGNSPTAVASPALSTGNKERDEVMQRARAILAAHSGTEATEDTTASKETSGSDSTRNSNVGGGELFDEDGLEDGVAPLGGSWPRGTGRSTSTRLMIQDPMQHLPNLHEEASRLLKNNAALDALNLFEVILDCQKRRNGPLHADVAAALHNVGIAQLRTQNHTEALKAFEEAARVRKGCLGRDHPAVAISLVKVGITQLLLHQFDDALWSFREALAVRKNALGPLHPSTARIYNNIGCVHVEFGEFKEARRAFEAALDVQRNALCHDPENGPLMFGAATTLCNLGYLYRYREMHAKAVLVLKEAVDLQEAVLGRSHATVLSTLDSLADSYANCGHAVDALRTYNMILERFRVGGKADTHHKMARAEAVLLYKMSRVYRQRNDREAQMDSLHLALRSLRSIGDETNKPGSLERRIHYDIRACREHMEKDELKWV